MNQAATTNVTSNLSFTEVLSRLKDVYWHARGSNLIARPTPGYQHHARLFAYLNPLRSTAIQVVDDGGIEWLYQLQDNNMRCSPCFAEKQVAAIVLCHSHTMHPHVLEICQQRDISVLTTSMNADEALTLLQQKVPRLFSPHTNIHGVFLAVMNTGVLITGTSGVGKSEVALDLVQRGHQLVADDAVSVVCSEGGILTGECSESLRGYIEIRGLGIINIAKMFGPASVLDHYPFQLMINLRDATDTEIRNVDRLQPSLNQVDILGVEVPCLTMLVAPGRNLAVLIEAATRDHLLRMSGTDSSLEFISQHDKLMNLRSA